MVPQKTKTELTYDPVIPLLGIFLEKTTIHKDTCTPVAPAALFTTAERWKQPKCSSTDEKIKKTCYLHRVEYYSATRKAGTVPFATTWTDLATILKVKALVTLPRLTLCNPAFGEGDGTPLQHSCLENPMDRGA